MNTENTMFNSDHLFIFIMWKYGGAKNDCNCMTIRRRTIPVWIKFDILKLKILNAGMTLKK